MIALAKKKGGALYYKHVHGAQFTPEHEAKQKQNYVETRRVHWTRRKFGESYLARYCINYFSSETRPGKMFGQVLKYVKIE